MRMCGLRLTYGCNIWPAPILADQALHRASHRVLPTPGAGQTWSATLSGSTTMFKFVLECKRLMLGTLALCGCAQASSNAVRDIQTCCFRERYRGARTAVPMGVAQSGKRSKLAGARRWPRWSHGHVARNKKYCGKRNRCAHRLRSFAIFCRTKNGAHCVARKLHQQSHAATQRERESALSRFRNRQISKLWSLPYRCVRRRRANQPRDQFRRAASPGALRHRIGSRGAPRMSVTIMTGRRPAGGFFD